MTHYTHVSFLRDAQREDPCLCCSQCAGEIYPGEVYYDMGGAAVCRDCLELFSRRHFRDLRKQAPWGYAR